MSTRESKTVRTRRWLRRLTDPTSAQHVVLTSAAVGALALVDPARRTVGGRVLLRAGTAVVNGFIAWCDARPTHSVSGRIGMTAASVGAGLALSEAGDAIDARLDGFVRRRGIRHPRLVLALFAAASMVGAHALSRRIDAASASDEYDDDFVDDDEPIEIPTAVRELVSALLARADGYGAPELRTQLDAARAMEYSGEDEGSFYPGIGFTMPADLPLAVPAEARFPVIGRYHPFDGRSADVYLLISDGRLASLNITTGEDWDVEEQIAWMEDGGSMQDLPGWPSADELTYFVETSAGLKPLG
ncbi:hypothetical protein [Microbacterium sp. PMB16]|uniref:hypothetical protein n=1 Tax=Microbacterium sp. PMB16 TaxID=3120157 RepID=UPI003F4C60EB